jgi:Phosphotransferase system cellobiose-specific component IIA
MVLDQRLEQIAMGIIANAGAARGAAFEALAEAKQANFEKAKELLVKSEKFAHDAHVRHSELLTLYSDGKIEHGDILLSHAQDQLMCAELARELISEIIELRETMERK